LRCSVLSVDVPLLLRHGTTAVASARQNARIRNDRHSESLCPSVPLSACPQVEAPKPVYETWFYIFTFSYVDDVRTSQETPLCASMTCYAESFNFLCVDDVRTSQETHLCASITCYEDSFNFLYVDDVRTSQETHLWPSTAGYGDSFNFFMSMMFVPHRKHPYVPP
jgi:hypothetical protein